MVFLLGLVFLLPVALGLGEGGLRAATNLSGLWGSFAAFYLLQFAGTAGAWIIVVLSLSALMAATLSWNPVRALVAPAPKAREDAEEGDEVEIETSTENGRKARRKDLVPNEPTPEEMRKRWEEARRQPPQEAIFEVRLEDYKEVSGVMLPHRFTQSVEGKPTEEWTVTSYKVNPSLKPESFVKKGSSD